LRVVLSCDRLGNKHRNAAEQKLKNKHEVAQNSNRKHNHFVQTGIHIDIDRASL